MVRGHHRARRVEPLDEPVSPHDLVSAFDAGANLCLLDSTGPVTELGRYSFLCAEPFYVFTSKGARAWAGPPGEVRRLPGRPLVELAALLRRFGLPVAPPPADAPPLLGGAVGYVGYETLYEIEDVPNRGRDDRPVPDCALGLYDVVLAHDRATGRSWLAANGFGRSPAEAQAAADARFEATLERVQRAVAAPTLDGDDLRARRDRILERRGRLAEAHLSEIGVDALCERAAYMDIVRRARERIFAGDVFEVCTTHRLETRHEADGFELFSILREVNAAPFSAYLRFPEIEVISSSPERFIRLGRDRVAQTRPVKGTRPRGATAQEDAAYADALRESQKDRAENLMIVDLARNDLGRVCRFGTIEVPELTIVENYPLQHQLVSTVQGELRPEVDMIDLLRAVYPGGSMTGAPKIEAMKIIDELEPVKRGIYSGALGYFDFDGALDLNIVIRTFIKTGDALTFHVGGAVVADSDPGDEYQETLDKAHGLLVALELQREGV